ncbi:MAG: 4Fe-4S dicluster domain-containing protein [Desulfovibrio sp.]|nr:4Fe-4S dicluster domain-containing protein [Desulfovibrio sp.]
MTNPFLPPLRPPGAVAEKRFASLCVRCGKCLEICPHSSIKLKGGFGKNRLTPYVDAEDRPCHLCMKCPPVCPTGALDQELDDLNKVKMGQAYILKDKCHNFTDGVMCSTCYDRCPIRGKGVVLEFGITPAMTKDCAGCGVCVYVCPLDAVVVHPNGYDAPPLSALPLAIQS